MVRSMGLEDSLGKSVSDVKESLVDRVEKVEAWCSSVSIIISHIYEMAEPDQKPAYHKYTWSPLETA